VLIDAVGLWNRSGELRRINLDGGLNIITGSSQTGKSALIEIIRYCLGSTQLRVPAGPIADTVAYYGLLVRVGETSAFLGRPALASGQQSTTEAQLEIGLSEFPEADLLSSNTTTEAVRDWLGRAIGIEENRFDPPAGGTRLPLVAKLAHALIHCFQRQDEIASRQILFHGQADSFVAQAIKDTLPYFLGVTGPEQLRRAATLRELRSQLAAAQRQRASAENTLNAGVDEAQSLLSQAAEAGLMDQVPPAPTLAAALARLAAVRDSPPPASPKQPEGEEFDRLQTERSELTGELGVVREQRALASAIAQSGDAARVESVEQVVRLQPIGILPRPDDPSHCPICEQLLETPLPAVDQLRASLDQLERQITAVERDRPGLVAVQTELLKREGAIRERIAGNRAALDRLVATAEAVQAHQRQLDLGTWVRGRIDHYLEKALPATERSLADVRTLEDRLRERVEALEAELDPARVREAAISTLIHVGRRMTEMAQQLGLEHADAGVRVDLARLTVVADTESGPVYMNANIGSAKNWVGYHLATVLGLQEHFISGNRPVPRFLVLDQPTQAFFPADRLTTDVDDQDREDALAQFELIRDVIERLESKLQVLVLDHADFDEEWFRDAVVERWRDGRALIPSEWLDDGDDDSRAPEVASPEDRPTDRGEND
jgi:hypothetical protein